MKKLIIAAIIIVTIAVLLFLSGFIFIVNQTDYAVVTRLGEISDVYTEPGLKFKIPFIEKRTIYNAKILTVDSRPENIVTGDKKKLILDNYVKWKIEDPKTFRNSLSNIARAQRRVSVIAHNALKDILGTKDLRSIITTDREIVTQEAFAIAKTNAKTLGIEIVDLRIKKVEFPEVNVQKAYDRMKAERYKEANQFRSRGEEEYLRIKAETDKETSIIKANATRESKFIKAKAEGTIAKIYADAYNVDPDFYAFYRSLKTLKATTDSATTLVISPKSELYKYLAGK
jgi:membrane protease subunit HflC